MVNQLEGKHFDREHFQEILLSCFVTEDQSFREKLSYHFQKTGKLLRPQLTFDLLLALGVSKSNAYQWAVITELIHNASLIHDDLQDQDEFRRGQLSFWKKFGAISAINAGDYLIMKSSDCIDNLIVSDAKKWRLNRVLMNCSMELVRGQELEIELKNFKHQDLWDRYLECIQRKTSSLFVMAIQAGQHLSELDINIQDLQEIFSQYGRCFQLYDDLIDIIGDKGREKKANDLREGKWSSLVVQYILSGNADEAALREFLDLERKKVTDISVEFWIKEFERSGAIQSTKIEIRNSLGELKDKISKSPRQIQTNMDQIIRQSFSEELLEV